MADNVYECMFIFDSNKYARDPNNVSGVIPKMVEECGGEILASRLWIEQKLAYPIQGHRKGTYWLTYFRMPGERVSDFNRACQLNDNILRNLTLKVDPRLASALVAHARGESVEAVLEGQDGAAEPADEQPAESTEGTKTADATEAVAGTEQA